MKKLIPFFSVLVFVLMPILVQAQDPDTVTIRELNTYPEPLTEYSEEAVEGHPRTGETVVYTAVIVSNPKTSGASGPDDTNGDGVIDDISRIHIFITDTTAASEGKNGMSMRIVESENWELLQSLNRGDIITAKGRLTFFNSSAQLTVDEEPSLIGNVNVSGFERYQDLLNPVEVTDLTELMTSDNDGTFQANIANYTRWNGTYATINNAVVSNVASGDRPNFALNKNGTRIYTSDVSLRFRNDRSPYLPNWNYRRAEDGDYDAPQSGAVVNISGFLILDDFANDGHFNDDSEIAFKINPFEDGVLWQEDINNPGEFIRCVDGQTCNGEILDWPNDVEIVGLPPVISNVQQSDSMVTSSTVVTVTAEIVGDDGNTVSGASLIYTDGSVQDTLAMSNTSGDTYSATLPTFDNFTAVSFFIEATDNQGISGRAPAAGNFGFFVQDEPIGSISLIQTTTGGVTGPSPLAGAGSIPVDISGIIVSDSDDGVIVLQDAAEAWSGIFLEQTSETEALSRGDSITVTSASVVEAAVSGGSNANIGLTQLVDLEFTLNSSGNDVDQVVPVIKTDSVITQTDGEELERYEGMLVKFEGVELIDRGIFGEFTLANTDANLEGGAIFNEDINSSAVGNTQASSDFNHTVREGKTLDAYAIVAASFGNPTFQPRDASDIIAADGNAFTPTLDFSLTGPSDSAEVVVDKDFTFTWNASIDFDEDDVTYQWRLLTEDTTEVLLSFDSDNDGVATMLLSPAEDVNSFLAERGIEVGQTASFVWHVRVTDGSDTLGVRGAYGNFGNDWEPIYRHITLERAIVNSNELDGSTPQTFALEQNYPNPFNPSTTIKFALPEAADVTLNVYNMLGQKVSTLVNKRMTAGSHDISFDASNLASGMYIYRIQAGSFNSIKKMMLIK